MIYLAEILQRQQMTLMLYFLLIGIYEIEFHSAELSTLTTVC